MHKVIVTNIHTNKEYTFYDICDKDGKVKESALDQAKRKYNELRHDTKLTITHVYPDYKHGMVKTDLIECNV